MADPKKVVYLKLNSSLTRATVCGKTYEKNTVVSVEAMNSKLSLKIKSGVLAYATKEEYEFYQSQPQKQTRVNVVTDAEKAQQRKAVISVATPNPDPVEEKKPKRNTRKKKADPKPTDSNVESES